MSDAANNIISFLIEEYMDEKGVHAETVLGALAAITGDQILRSTADIENVEDAWISSDAATEAIFGNEGVYEHLCAVVRNAGGDLANVEDPESIIKRTVEAIGGSPFPPLTIPNDNYPLEFSPNAAFRYREKVRDILDQHNIPQEEYGQCCGYALGQLIDQMKEVLDPALSLKIASEIMFGVTKMNMQKEF